MKECAMTARARASRIALVCVLGVVSCDPDNPAPSTPAGSPSANSDSPTATTPGAAPSSDNGPLGVHRPFELIEAATNVVGFLRGEVAFDRIRLADTVSLYLGLEEGGTRAEVERGMLRYASNWKVRSQGLRHVYSFAPPRGSAKLTTRVGRHLNCADYPLSSTFAELARLPHVGTTLMYGADSCLQSWNLTLVFDPNEKPPTVIAAVYDQWEW
jgi:hypothetical protein